MGTTRFLQRCALESIRLAQRSIMMRALLSPVEVDDGTRTYRVEPDVVIATMLPLTNTSARRARSLRPRAMGGAAAARGGGPAGKGARRDVRARATCMSAHGSRSRRSRAPCGGLVDAYELEARFASVRRIRTRSAAWRVRRSRVRWSTGDAEAPASATRPTPGILPADSREAAAGYRRAIRPAGRIAASVLRTTGSEPSPHEEAPCCIIWQPPSAGARRRGALALASVVAFVGSPSFAASAHVWRVGTYRGIAGQFHTIQAAVNAARPGDWILGRTGDYHENGSTDPGCLPAC